MKKALLTFLALWLMTSAAWAQSSAKVTLQTAAAAIGNGVTTSVKPYASIGLDISITGTATVTFEGHADAASGFQLVQCANATTGTVSTSTSASGLYHCPVASMAEFRTPVSAYTSGTITVSGTLSGAVFQPLTAPSAANTLSDGNSAGVADVIGSNPVGTEQGLVTRNIPSGTQGITGTVGGLAAIDAAVSGGPVIMGGRASAADPADVSADGDAQAWWLDLKGRGHMICDSGCSGGTQYAEDAVHASGNLLTMAGAVRRDTAASSSATDGDNVTINTDASGRVWTHVGAIDAGDTNIGNVDLASAIPAGTNNIGFTSPAAAATSGATPYTLTLAATTNATTVKASAGNVYSISVYSINAAARYLKFYNKASAPTCNSDTVVYKVMIPGNTAGTGAVIPLPVGLFFSTGISFCATTGIADSDNTAVAASEIIVSLGYQ